jgi:hypothetical protein
MWTEIRTLVWLQWRLTRAIFRSRRESDRLYSLSLVLRAIGLAVAIPLFLLLGAGLAVGMILLSPGAAFELAMIANTFMFFIWLVLPTSYNSQLFERFEMSRLFVHPISFRGIVAGSTLISLLTATGIWTVPLLAAQVVGFAYHQPLALPLILLGAVPTFALLILTGRVVEDFFDLVAGDRRLRAIVLALLSLPFILCWLGQYAAQYASDNFADVSRILPSPLRDQITGLGAASGLSEFLEMLGVSRLLIWLPPGWGTAAMGLASTGEWGKGLLFLAFSLASVALLLWIHAGITRRLMAGAALSVGAERVRSRRWEMRLPGPSSFWALLRKDWVHLWRSPMPRRLIFSSVLMAAAMLLPLRNIADEVRATPIADAMPMLAFAGIATMAGMAINMGLTANYFGTIDREGFATLVLTAYDRRHVLLAANLIALLYSGVQYLVLALVVAAVTRTWAVLPLGALLGLCLQIGGTPAYSLASIIGPYRAQLMFSSGARQRGNLWGILAWLVSAPPVLLLVMLPYVFWKPGLAITLPLAVAYTIGLYLVTLKPLARLLQRREHTILEAVVAIAGGRDARSERALEGCGDWPIPAAAAPVPWAGGRARADRRSNGDARPRYLLRARPGCAGRPERSNRRGLARFLRF